MTTGGRERIWRPTWHCHLGRMLSQRRRGAGDPTYRLEGERHWLGLRTPAGPVALALVQAGGGIHAEAWGAGAEWALDAVPGMLGEYDDPAGFQPTDPLLREVSRRVGEIRFGRTGLVMDALVPAILEQKVTGKEAFAGYRRLVRRYGERAPGPHSDLWLQPTPGAIRGVPSWAWLRMHVDPGRSRTLVHAARVASSLERLASLPPDEADRRLRTLDGVGIWTSAEVRQRSHGDADAVPFGDYHIAKDVGWALTGERWDDDRLAEFLEPYRPHRARIPELLRAAGLGAPRRGPRMPPRTHLPAG